MGYEVAGSRWAGSSPVPYPTYPPRALDLEVPDCNCPRETGIPACAIFGGCAAREKTGTCSCAKFVPPCEHVKGANHDEDLWAWYARLRQERGDPEDQDSYHDSYEPLVAVAAQPGSAEKIRVMRARLARGEDLHHPADPKLPEWYEGRAAYAS